MCHYYIWCFLLTHWHTFWNFDAGTFLLLWKCSVGCFLYNEKSESESHSVMSTSLQNHGLYSPWNSPGQNTGMVAIPFSKVIFPTQGLNPGLPHCKWILYQLSHQGSWNVLINLTNYFKRIFKTRQTRLNMELLLLSPTSVNWDNYNFCSPKSRILNQSTGNCWSTPVKSSASLTPVILLRKITLQ